MVRPNEGPRVEKGIRMLEELLAEGMDGRQDA
jgi:hypothetical protein